MVPQDSFELTEALPNSVVTSAPEVISAPRVISQQNAFLITQALNSVIWGADWAAENAWQGTGFEEEGVTFTAAVPTIWLMLLQHMQAEGLKLSTLKSVAIGGSACPQSMIEVFENDYGVKATM